MSAAELRDHLCKQVITQDVGPDSIRWERERLAKAAAFFERRR